jgi:hypothetical protein
MFLANIKIMSKFAKSKMTKTVDEHLDFDSSSCDLGDSFYIARLAVLRE